MKITVRAHSNIAFIKYWGKKNEKLRLPRNGSVSMNLSEAYSTTSVEISENHKEDKIYIDKVALTGKEKERTVKHLDVIRKLAKSNEKAHVVSQNNFPKGTGMASSASGFAALTLAATKAYGLNLSQKELSILARVGSGSACRSIPDGFVEWKEGQTNETSYAKTLFAPSYWALRDIVVIVGKAGKKVSSSEGHAMAESSPFFETRIKTIRKKLSDLKKALKRKDFTNFGKILEEEAINMHTVMMTSNPPLFYWTPKTLEVMLKIHDLRDKGVEAYFTIDAGPNVHVICMEKSVSKIKKSLSGIKGVKKILVNAPSKGAYLL